MNATGVTAGPAESNGRLLLSKWRDSLHVTCGQTACRPTPGSAPGPTLGNEYGKTLPFLAKHVQYRTDVVLVCNQSRPYSYLDALNTIRNLALWSSRIRALLVAHSSRSIGASNVTRGQRMPVHQRPLYRVTEGHPNRYMQNIIGCYSRLL